MSHTHTHTHAQQKVMEVKRAMERASFLEAHLETLHDTPEVRHPLPCTLKANPEVRHPLPCTLKAKMLCLTTPAIMNMCVCVALSYRTARSLSCRQHWR